jgi:shikimate kinase
MREENMFSVSISRIYLIGMMGAGKSVTGRLLAEKLDYTFVDTDELVEAQGMTIPELFETKGEEAFRQMERDALVTCFKMHRTVFATGGGLPCHFDNLNAMLNNGVVIYLQASAKTLLKRLEADLTKRPLLSASSDMRIHEIETLLRQRKSCYEQAHHVVDVNRGDNNVIVNRLVKILIA